MIYALRSCSRGLILSTVFLLGLVPVGGCRWNKSSSAIRYIHVESLRDLGRDIGEPFGIAVKEDTIYFSDGVSGSIRAIDPDGTSRTVATGLKTPSGIAFLPDGDLVVADTGSHTIRKVSVEGTVTILAGIENVSGSDDGPNASATFTAPAGVAATPDGNVYVADTYNDRIRVIDGQGLVRTLAGSVRGFADGPGAGAQFDTPLGLVAWEDKLLVADSGNGRVRVVEKKGAVSTLAGTGHGSFMDGTLASADFVLPTAVGVDRFGQVFVADGNAIRVMGRRPLPFVETLTGGQRGHHDGTLAEARFSRPSGIAVDQHGELYIADSDNRTIRVISDRQRDRADKVKLAPAEAPSLPLASRWPFDPPFALREVAGTMGEIRGELGPENKPVWFHNGLDIAGAYGETAKFIRDETVLDPHSAQNFGTARELLRLPTIGYIHLRLGRNSADVPLDDARFQFDRDASGKLSGLRVPRGSFFAAGETLGTLNSQNHVHLIAGRSGDEINALAALTLPGISDTIAPVIERVSLLTSDWREIETSTGTSRTKLTDRTRIVARAYDRMDGNSDRRRLGVYKIGYQVVPKGAPGGEIRWTIVFDRMPSNEAVRFAYASGSKSGYTSETVFNYIASNRLSGDHFAEEFLDPAAFSAGEYVLRVFAADFFGNSASKDLEIEVIK
ncbi:MAG TPA: SMP-30/gluconolactonase/LRE family protein [Pyrinomonadaceae bacterium]|nr:SMP-30/gluconolactonase/LRE family protein [Pyrinomonadaceae bacterium]